jgi:peptide deformylase
MYENLCIIRWPDPRLKQPSKPIERFDDKLRLLATRMLEVMKQSKGVGLAAAQVGLNVRMFVMNPTGQELDDRVYINPVLSEGDGEEEEDEGCLSLPGLSVNVERFRTIRLTASDLDGKPSDEVQSGYLARIWQHELDHLNGTLLIDRMGPVARLANRRLLKKLEEEFKAAHAPSITTVLPPAKRRTAARASRK